MIASEKWARGSGIPLYSSPLGCETGNFCRLLSAAARTLEQQGTQDRYRRWAEKSVAQLLRHSSFGSTWPSTIHDASPSKATAVTMIFLRKSSLMAIWICSGKGTPKTVLTGIQLNNMNQLTPLGNFEG
jgi:hypothetical protein